VQCQQTCASSGRTESNQGTLIVVADVRPLAATEIDTVASVLGLARLHQGDGFYLVAWGDNEPLGHRHLARSNPPEVHDLYVRREHRRHGVATTLIRHADNAARARGFDRMRLGVGVDNDAAQAFYRRYGYVDVGFAPRRVKGTIEIRTGLIDGDDTLLILEKRLSRSVP
jgi:ribosomal protein S18 acetylase RimI-like enzyme